jgi:uncharacterized membrane protein YbhN (UPF0104 family)
VKNKSAKISVAVKLLVSLGIIWLLLYKIDLHRLLYVIGLCKWFYLSLALIMFLFSKILSSIRLNLFFRVIGIRISETFNLKLYLLGMYYNLFLPGGIGGDGYKVYFLRKRFNINSRRIIATILLDRISGLFALLCFLALLSFFIGYPRSYKYSTWVSIPVATAFFYHLLKKFFPEYIPVFGKTNLMSAGVQAAQLFSVYFILCALGHSTDYAAYLFVFLVSSIVAVIPFTIGGLGARELTFFVGAQWLHLDINISLAVSLIFFATTALVSLWGIVYSFRNLEHSPP